MLTLLAAVLAWQAPPEPKPLERMAEAIRRYRAVSFEMGGFWGKVKYRLRPPGRFAIIDGAIGYYADGSRAWRLDFEDKSWRPIPMAFALPSMKELPGFGLLFPGGRVPVSRGPVRDAELEGERVIAVPMARENAVEGEAYFLLLDPKTWLSRGGRTFRNGKVYMTWQYTNVVLDSPYDSKEFQYSILRGFKKSRF